MAEYHYKASDSLGKIIEGHMEASGENAAAEKLQSLGLIPVKISLPKPQGVFSAEIFDFPFFKRVSQKEVMIFTQELSTLVESGLSLDKSLNILVELTESKKFKPIVENLLKNIEEGSSLGDAFAQHPRVFSRLYVNMVKAGEVGGVLEVILRRLAEYLESFQELKEYLGTAMIYPVLLTFVGGASIIALLTFVIPQFAVIFADMGQTLPLPTRILLGISKAISRYWWLILIMTGGVFWGWKAFVKTKDGRFKWDSLKLKWGVVKKLVQKLEIARFSRTFGTLIRSGVPILQSLSIVKETVQNEVIVRAIGDVYNKIKEGGDISPLLKESDVFPPLAVHMIAVGEETGRLDEMLLKIAATYDAEVKTAVKRLVALLEPAMILFMAIVVGFIVISMLIAIVSINEIPF